MLAPLLSLRRWLALLLMLSLLVLPASTGDARPGSDDPASGALAPAIFFSTYLGGEIFDHALGIAVDMQGNIYLTGYTASNNFPTLNAYQPVSGGQGDAFVSKFGPGGTLIYSTYLGGNYVDYATAIAVDAQGSAYVTGWTGSNNFPTVSAFQPSYQGGWTLS
jgi:hypothetical protein